MCLMLMLRIDQQYSYYLKWGETENPNPDTAHNMLLDEREALHGDRRSHSCWDLRVSGKRLEGTWAVRGSHFGTPKYYTPGN